jgi:2-aminoadipate transaminase
MTVAASFLEQHDLNAHVLKLREAYTRKRDLMLSTLRKHFPQEMTFTEPYGGLFTWATFPQGFDTARFMAEVALPEAKVAFVPGASFFSTNEEIHHARFNFSGPSDEQIAAGIERLGHPLKKAMRK